MCQRSEGRCREWYLPFVIDAAAVEYPRSMKTESDTSTAKKHVTVTQAESKRVVAILGHLRQIVRAVTDAHGRLIRPVSADHPELVLASASLRALLFDDTPSPMLLDFLEIQKLNVKVETVEVDSVMLFLSNLADDSDVHLSDFLVEVLHSEELKKTFELGIPSPIVQLGGIAKVLHEDLLKKHQRWMPSADHAFEKNISLGYQRDQGFSQYAEITRRIVDIREWGAVRVGHLKDAPIRRRSVISYVANKLGGVHYDSKRLPSDSTEAHEFRVLATAYDWNAQSVMHAGLVVVAIACIELIRVPEIQQLFQELGQFHQQRQARLKRGELLPPSTVQD